HVTEDTLGRLWTGQQYPDSVSRVTGPGQYTTYTSSNSLLTAGQISSVVPDPAAAGGAGWVWVSSPFGMSHTNGDQWETYPRELLGLTQNSTNWLINCLDR